MIKITGLDKLIRELDLAQKAFAELDGKLGSVRFDPSDPESIEAAIKGMEDMVDGRLAPYASNSIVAPMIAAMKASYRKQLLDRAAAARLGMGAADGE